MCFGTIYLQEVSGPPRLQGQQGPQCCVRPGPCQLRPWHTEHRSHGKSETREQLLLGARSWGDFREVGKEEGNKKRMTWHSRAASERGLGQHGRRREYKYNRKVTELSLWDWYCLKHNEVLLFFSFYKGGSRITAKVKSGVQCQIGSQRQSWDPGSLGLLPKLIKHPYQVVMKQRKGRHKAGDDLVREGPSDKERGEFFTVFGHFTGPPKLEMRLQTWKCGSEPQPPHP